MVLAHGGTVGTVAEAVLLLVPLIVVLVMARRRATADQREQEGADDR